MSPDTAKLSAPKGSVPVPDPTELTTAALLREISSLKEVIFTRIDGMDRAISLFNSNMTRVPTDTDKAIYHLQSLHEAKIHNVDEERQLSQTVIETRLDGMDKAIRLLQDTADKFPGRIDEKINSLKDVHLERFSSIAVQFNERDVRTESSARDSKVAVDAALQAAKEAVAEQNRSSALAIQKSEASTIKQIDQMGLLLQTGNKAVDDKFDDVKERLTRLEGQGQGKSTMIAAVCVFVAIAISAIALLMKK
jgi:hypothetical protein